eukprot:1111971_1
MIMNVAFLVVLSHRICLSSSFESCLSYRECSNQSLELDAVHAYGYQSAFGPLTSFFGRNINCDGALSCSQMAFITLQAPSTGYGITSRGTYASSHTIMLDTADGILCHGLGSCRFSNITMSNDSPLECNGYLSCSNTYIHTNGATIEAYGRLSLYKSIIDTTSSTQNTNTINLLGSLSGFGAKLICATGHTCNINCVSYDACYAFYVVCSGSCVVDAPIHQIRALPIDITSTNSINATLTASIPKVFETEAVLPSDNLLCTMFNFDDDQEHNGGLSIVIEANEEGPVCARARESLKNVHNIIYKTKTNNDLICSGYGACRASTIISNNGTIYCEAQSACHSSNITNAHDVYCAGAWSCQQSNIANANYVVCTGHVSCLEATFVNHGKDLNLYFLARNAGRDATVYCNVTNTGSCNVYCNGRGSCSGTRLFCSHNCEVECHQEEAECPIIFEPTLDPTDSTNEPTHDPSRHPSQGPTFYPTRAPTHPTANPTAKPTQIPTARPTTTEPSSIPTQGTEQPSNPTRNPSSDYIYAQQPTLNPVMMTTYSGQTSADAITTQEHKNRLADPEVGADNVARALLIIIGIIICIIGILVYLLYYFCRKTKMEKRIGDEKGTVSTSTNINRINSQSMVESVPWNQSTIVQTPTQGYETNVTPMSTQCNEPGVNGEGEGGRTDQGVTFSVADGSECNNDGDILQSVNETAGYVDAMSDEFEHPGENHHGEGKNVVELAIAYEGGNNNASDEFWVYGDGKDSNAHVTIGNNMEEEDIAPDEFIVSGDDDMITKF